MKKSKLTIIIIITLFLTIVSNSINAQCQQDSKYGFKINIPTDWSKSSFMDGNDKVYDYYSADQNAAIQIRVFEAGGGVTTDMLAQIYEENMLSAGTQKLSLKNHSMNGIPGKQGIYLMDYNGVEVGLSAYYFSQNNNCYILTTIIPSSMIQQKGAELKQILKSFTIDGFEAPANIVKEEKIHSGLNGLLGGSTNTNNQSGSNSFGNNQGVKDCSAFVYEGQTYRTVQIGNQCWMAENLNVGTMILSSKTQNNNNIVEKYCYDNGKLNCDKKGGLYIWKEMMQYAESDYGDIGHTKGICPQGWHLPTDKEWMVLEGFVDGEYGIGDDIWYGWRTRGTDAAKKLKSKNGWTQTIRRLPPDGTDDYGFTVKPAGFKMHGSSGKFFKENSLCILWTATKTSKKSDRVFYREFSNAFDKAFRDAINQNAYSVRCIKN